MLAHPTQQARQARNDGVNPNKRVKVDIKGSFDHRRNWREEFFEFLLLHEAITVYKSVEHKWLEAGLSGSKKFEHQRVSGDDSL
jgi:hypothetical protein